MLRSLRIQDWRLRRRDWNIEWKPAPYPCTAAQREAAAKRYGLLLTDYQPFEDDGYAPGDYPDMKNFNEANRDPWEHYDYYPVKRNYNEPVPFYWEFYSEAGADPDFQEVHHYGQPMWWVFFKFLLPPILVGGFALLLEPYSFFQPEAEIPPEFENDLIVELCEGD
ncbi:hypothetical protein T265_07323 [Opisthorchis viverrini]|uniref:NADH dehydrogenase [ubiquinone] 1 beta subcomplex subunit 8, mitochondrial n=1 Tax=Opisthorchis viverrini TaxID=6198 RepID=A0A075ABY7_OPIVI|nr:hypothetical protein T265_07323 [Opisthorchis viverrini]KER25159.1 hypothetical protein T265_07323 [Opisthorchis viverrini]